MEEVNDYALHLGDLNGGEEVAISRKNRRIGDLVFRRQKHQIHT